MSGKHNKLSVGRPCFLEHISGFWVGSVIIAQDFQYEGLGASHVASGEQVRCSFREQPSLGPQRLRVLIFGLSLLLYSYPRSNGGHDGQSGDEGDRSLSDPAGTPSESARPVNKVAHFRSQSYVSLFKRLECKKLVGGSKPRVRLRVLLPQSRFPLRVLARLKQRRLVPQPLDKRRQFLQERVMGKCNNGQPLSLVSYA